MGVRPVSDDVKLPLLFSVLTVNAGAGLVDQTTPCTVTGVPPSELITPPPLAVDVVIDPGTVVVNTGRLESSFFSSLSVISGLLAGSEPIASLDRV